MILVTCDTLRADHLGAYGYARPTSPGVDAFAADATLFENAWTTAPSTAPAIASLFSSRLPDEIGMGAGNAALLPSEVETLPEILSGQGVTTAAVVSNWVLRRPPPEHAGTGVQQGFEHFDDEMKAREQNRDFFDRSGEDTTDAAIAWLTGTWLHRLRDRPDARLFLWVHFQDPHGPYTPPDRLAALFDDPSSKSEPLLKLGETQTGYQQIPAYQILNGERRPGFYRDRYDAEIRGFDDAFKRLIAWLKANGLYEGSLIVLTADHGESLGEHGYWFCHGENTFAEEVRVPLIVRYPSGRRGERRADLASLLDVAPTVLESFGLAPRPCRGMSLLARSLPHDRVVPQSNSVEGKNDRWTAVTGERFRLIAASQGAARLFDRQADPAETVDLLEREGDRGRELLTQLSAFLARDARPKVSHGILRKHEDMDDQTRAALKRLGYVDGE